MEENERQEVRLLLKKINDAWLNQPPERLSRILKNCFDDRMVVKGPGFRELARSSQASVESYEDFVHQAAVRECKFSEPDIDLWDDTAVATYFWEISYELNGQDYHESGHDLFVMTRSGGRWRAVWRAMLPQPAI